MQSFGDLGGDLDACVDFGCDAFKRSTDLAVDAGLFELFTDGLVEALLEGSVLEGLGGSDSEFIADGAGVGGVVVVKDEIPGDGTIDGDLVGLVRHTVVLCAVGREVRKGCVKKLLVLKRVSTVSWYLYSEILQSWKTTTGHYLLNRTRGKHSPGIQKRPFYHLV